MFITGHTFMNTFHTFMNTFHALQLPIHFHHDCGYAALSGVLKSDFGPDQTAVGPRAIGNCFSNLTGFIYGRLFTHSPINHEGGLRI